MKKIESILFATGNKHKIEEVEAIVNKFNVKIEPINECDVEETGTTFRENSLLKAKYYWDKYHKPVLSDDSGLECDGLNGAPGIYSSRYSGGSSLDNINLLVKNLKNNPNKNAHFVSTICFIDENGEVHYFEGYTYGKIIDTPRGSGTFGYDPVFLSNDLNKTFAEVSTEEKNSVSHRGRALEKLSEYFKEHYKN